MPSSIHSHSPGVAQAKGSARTHQVLARPQVYLLHQGASEVVAQGDDAEGELREERGEPPGK